MRRKEFITRIQYLQSVSMVQVHSDWNAALIMENILIWLYYCLTCLACIGVLFAGLIVFLINV